jgi:hypothetical protein
MDFIADYLFRSDDGYVTRQVLRNIPRHCCWVNSSRCTIRVSCSWSIREATTRRRFARWSTTVSRECKRRWIRRRSRALEAFKYHLLSDLQTPTEMADNFGWYSVEGAPDYAPGANGDGGIVFQDRRFADARFRRRGRAEVFREGARRRDAAARTRRSEKAKSQ